MKKRKVSDIGVADLMTQALGHFKVANKMKRFNMVHCWTMVKGYPMWHELYASYDANANPGKFIVIDVDGANPKISSEDTQSSQEDSSSGTSGENTMPSQPDLPPPASKKRSAPEPASSQASPKAGQGGLRTKSRCIKRARKTPQTSSSEQELSNTDDTSSGEVKEVVMPSTALDLATSKSGVDNAATLATPSAETQKPIASSSAAPMVLGEISVSGLMRKKAVLDAKTNTASTAELEILRKELEDLEERVRVTKQLIQDKEALIARFHEEAEGLKAELKTDLAEIRALNKQLVTGQDEDDEAEIAEVDRVRASALQALEAFLQ
ncbi:hypothetical protein QYE76_028507 [Lolium multiflorum]|uniref:Uncharacterized protein n=1 Tax=Lolium multiflorum TaxID=4521 RepID=A0AAD8VFU7_LOLMU|nr:hypothetical protein QYE76_028507 [Lolium multiflorum]